MRRLRPADELFLVDSSSFIHRDYHASKAQDRAYNVNDRGQPIGSIKRFMERLYWWRRAGVQGRHPTHMACVFDASRRNWRHAIFPAYKAKRPELEDDLHVQLPLMRDVARAMGVCAVEEIGYEADDLIATYALTAVEQDAGCLIISGDKDLLQLVRPGLRVFDPPAGTPGFHGHREARMFDSTDSVGEKFGVPPHLVVDFQALAGDPGDGVPGVTKVGSKRAIDLLAEFGSLDAILAAAPARAAEPKALVMWKNLAAEANQARLYRRVVTLDTAVEYSTPISAMALDEFDPEPALAFAHERGLDSVVRTIEKGLER